MQFIARKATHLYVVTVYIADAILLHTVQWKLKPL